MSSEYRSVRLSTARFIRPVCSGDMYGSDPSMSSGGRDALSSRGKRVASPRSASFTSSVIGWTRMFSGFRSRCTMPPRCRSSTAPATRTAISRNLSVPIGSGPTLSSGWPPESSTMSAGMPWCVSSASGLATVARSSVLPTSYSRRCRSRARGAHRRGSTTFRMTDRRSAHETARYMVVPPDSWRVSAIAYFCGPCCCSSIEQSHYRDAGGAQELVGASRNVRKTSSAWLEDDRPPASRGGDVMSVTCERATGPCPRTHTARVAREVWSAISRGRPVVRASHFPASCVRGTRGHRRKRHVPDDEPHATKPPGSPPRRPRRGAPGGPARARGALLLGARGPRRHARRRAPARGATGARRARRRSRPPAPRCSSLRRPHPPRGWGKGSRGRGPRARCDSGAARRAARARGGRARRPEFRTGGGRRGGGGRGGGANRLRRRFSRAPAHGAGGVARGRRPVGAVLRKVVAPPRLNAARPASALPRPQPRERARHRGGEEERVEDVGGVRAPRPVVPDGIEDGRDAEAHEGDRPDDAEDGARVRRRTERVRGHVGVDERDADEHEEREAHVAPHADGAGGRDREPAGRALRPALHPLLFHLLLRVGRSRERMEPGLQPAERRLNRVELGDATPLVPAPRQDHVARGGEDEDEDRGHEDGKPELRDEGHRDLDPLGAEFFRRLPSLGRG